MKKLSFILGTAIVSTLFIGCGCTKQIEQHKRVFAYIDSTSFFSEDPNVPGVILSNKDSIFMDIRVDKKGKITTRLTSEYMELLKE